MNIIDFHTHAFPDPLAERAMKTLLAETDEVQAHLDGRIGSLLESMDRAGISTSVLCSIATRPEQFESILAWSASIASGRIVPFPSVHPFDPAAVEHVAEIAAAGFKGLKLHPYYQDFMLDDARVMPLYAAVVEHDLLLVCHTGFDIAFPRVRRADPVRVLEVVRQYPELKFVATHLGAWSDWEEVRRHLIGKPIYMEISFACDDLAPETAREMMVGHPEDYVLFGTDSPWQDQAATLAWVRALELGGERERKLLSANALALLA